MVWNADPADLIVADAVVLMPLRALGGLELIVWILAGFIGGYIVLMPLRALGGLELNLGYLAGKQCLAKS